MRYHPETPCQVPGSHVLVCPGTDSVATGGSIPAGEAQNEVLQRSSSIPSTPPKAVFVQSRPCTPEDIIEDR